MTNYYPKYDPKLELEIVTPLTVTVATSFKVVNGSLTDYYAETQSSSIFDFDVYCAAGEGILSSLALTK